MRRERPELLSEVLLTAGLICWDNRDIIFPNPFFSFPRMDVYGCIFTTNGVGVVGVASFGGISSFIPA
ncbi:uncharacterized [Tachysurus ichikawai]